MIQFLMVSTLLLQLARGVWFINPTHAEAYKPVTTALLLGKKVDFSALMPEQSGDGKTLKAYRQYYVNNAAIAPTHKTYKKIEEAPQGSVAVTPLTGVVMKDDYCGSPGTKTLNKWMCKADASPNIIGHILYIDSPGGSADGTMDFSEAIKSLSKPVVAFSDGLMASAAYWIGSSAKHIMASNSLNEIGSIGTYMTLYDWTEYYEMMGIKEIQVYASKSTEKNIEYREAIKGNTDPLLNNMINPFNEAFLNSVTRNRYGRNLNKDKTLKGQLHLTNDALQYGLIDSVGSFTDAIKTVQKLAA